VSDPEAGALPSVAYIAGYGRSGSTWLARLLGQAPGACAGGELARNLDWIDSQRPCACGAPLAGCAFWTAVRAGLPRGGAGGRFWRAMLESPLVLYFGFRWIPAAERRRYRLLEAALFRGIARRCGAQVVVDSSKTARRAAGRPAALAEVAGLDVRVIHLVRNPQGVRASLERGTNKALEGRAPPHRWFRRLRAFAGWTMANSFARRAARRAPAGKALRLDFERLGGDPVPALAAVAGILGLSLARVDAVLEGRERAVPEHLAEGNRMRLEPLTAQPAEPVRTTFTDRLLGFLVCGWTCRRLGISPFGATGKGHE
jgi:hypothetical protein